MERFECVRCGTEFTKPLKRVPGPRLSIWPCGHRSQNRPLLATPGTCLDAPPVDIEFHGVPGARVFAPGDVFGTRLVFEKCSYECCYGVRSEAGGNLACAGCGAMVGAHVDDCQAWRQTRLDPAAVRAVPTPEPPRPDGPYETATRAVRDAERRAYLGDGPGDERQDPRTNALWCQEILSCVIDVLIASGGSVIAPTGRRVRTLAGIAARMLDSGRLLSLDGARTEGTAGARRLLDAAESWDPCGELTLLSFERSAAPATASARWLAENARRLGRESPRLRLVNVGPASDAPAEGPVRWINLPTPVWRYLERVESDDNALAATRWRKRGLDTEVFRDEALDMEFTPAGPVDLASEFAFQRSVLGRLLQEGFDEGEPWMDDLILRLLPEPWRRLRQSRSGGRPGPETAAASPQYPTTWPAFYWA